MKKLFSFLMVALLAFAFVACGGETTETTQQQTTEQTTQEQTTTDTQAPVNTAPVLNGVVDIELAIGDVFDPMIGVTASDAEDGDLTTMVMIQGTANLQVAGDYVLTYSVTDSQGETATVQRTVSVSALQLESPTGFYDWKFATTELRHTFMAAAEKFLMNNMAGGIPLFSNSGYVLYSSRISLPVNAYVPVMGWGSSLGTMTADDSTVIMADGLAGEVGEYTYRTRYTTDPTTYNQWKYKDSGDSDLMGFFYDAPYEYTFNANKDGYELVPGMASALPVAMNTTQTATGKDVATVWRFSLRDDLVWKFHPDTASDGFDTVIDANDFVGTYKLALDENWFRAISGGGDFTNESTGIKNAQAYVDGEATWEEVGIKMIDNLTIEFEFVNLMSEWNVRYFLSSFVMTPINLELYDALLNDGDDTTNYGTSLDTVAYHGAYYVDYHETGKLIEMKKNDLYYDQNKYFYTGYQFNYIKDSAIAWSEFNDGKLESTGVPSEHYDSVKNHPGIKYSPGSTTFRIMINGLGDTTAQQEQFPGSTYVPEPILASEDFKMAMFHGIDREYLAHEVMKTATPNMYLFSDAYVVDAETAIRYRETTWGDSVGVGLSPSTHGYNPSAATALYEKALNQLVADGVYTAGTDGNETIIELDFFYFSGSISQSSMASYLKTQFESLFQSDVHYIDVQVNIEAKDFPGIYYDFMMTGSFDMSIGGISGSTLDAASFLDTFSSDNRGGFTLNWGIETGEAEIEVLYRDHLGHQHYELWSFDAIYSALNGRVYLQDGVEAEVPAALTTEKLATEFTFEIVEFDNPSYENITYTVQVYDGSGYVNVEGLVDVVPASSTVTVDSGILPYYYWYGIDGSILERFGDYQVVINYTYVEDGSAGQSIGAWFNNPQLLAESAPLGVMTPDVVTPTSVEFGITPSSEYTGTITGIRVSAIGEWVELTGLTVDFSDASAISIDGLSPDGYYLAEITFDDGLWDCVRFFTDAVMEYDDVVADETSASIPNAVLNDEDGVTRAITAAVVYLVVEDGDNTVVAGAAVDYADLSSIAVSGLAAETDYVVEFTFDDGTVQEVAVTTTAAAE